MHYWDGGWHMGWMWIWWVLGVLLVVAVVWIAVIASRGGPRPVGERPDDVLKRRYALGEIDRDTYERMLADLKK